LDGLYEPQRGPVVSVSEKGSDVAGGQNRRTGEP